MEICNHLQTPLLCIATSSTDPQQILDKGHPVNQHHYQRSDAGQEKTKYPVNPPISNLAKRPLKDLPEALRAQIAQQVLSRYLHGEQVAAMALELETSDVTLYALLLRDHENEWKDAQIARALARLERENSNLEVAPTPLSLARARELVRSAQWELERLLSRIYAQKQEHTVTGPAPMFQITIVQSVEK